MFCHTEIEVADQTFHLIHSLYTDTGPTSPSTDPIMPGAWQGSYLRANFIIYGSTPEKSCRKQNLNNGISTPEADALTTRPARRFTVSFCYELGNIFELSPISLY